jgi:hypothetical protein
MAKYFWGDSSINWGSPTTTWSGNNVVTYVPQRYQLFSIESYTMVDGLPKAAADTTREPVISRTENGPSGYWMVFAYLPDGTKVDVTVFRGAPTQISGITTTDPFGPAAATISFPAITIMDAIGTGDLYWLNPEYNVDLVWMNSDPNWGAVDTARYTWEGYFVSYAYSSGDDGSGLSVSCVGALRQLDNYLAKPEYVTNPMPYEYAIRRAFLDESYSYAVKKQDLRLADPQVTSAAFPASWSLTYSSSNYDATNAPWTVPVGVNNGDKWTGLITRNTGNWEATLTGYISGLLSNMQCAQNFGGIGTPAGQFTLLLDSGRVPSLKYRNYVTGPTQTPLIGEILTVDLLWPGVQLQLTADFTQRAAVVYSTGQSRNGAVYSGMEVSNDAAYTYYDPAAYDSTVHPQRPSNAFLDLKKMRKEVKVDFSDGLTPKEAQNAAKAYLNRFSDPGVTGNINLNVDPVRPNGRPFPRQIIQAGQTIFVKGVFQGSASSSGMYFHVTETSLDGEGQIQLTIDSKYRDQLTVDQIRLRGRDSLVPFRVLSTADTYSPKVPDLLYPWNYSLGSGVVPEWRTLGSTLTPTLGSSDAGLFVNGANYLSSYGAYVGFYDDPNTVDFPWTPYTKQFPPRYYPQYYIKVPARNAKNASMNWANAGYSASATDAANLSNFKAYRFKLAAKGDIRLFQMCAYTVDGNVKPVRYHVSLYRDSISYMSMPNLPAGATLPRDVTYATDGTMYYPFFAEAWNKLNPDGTVATNVQQRLPADSGSFMIGWGNYYEKAGYWPGSSAKGDAPTGQLVDEVGFSWDYMNGNASRIDPQRSYNPSDTLSNYYRDIWAYVMVYCDDSATDTYFLGRLWNKSYGEYQ